MADNRRRHLRVRAQGIVAHLRGPSGRYPCTVENISVGGLFVRTDRVLDVGTRMEVDLVRPGWKRGLSFYVRVTSRIDPLAGRFAKITPGMGVQFFGKMEETQRERLLALLRELGAPEPEPESVTLDGSEMDLPPVQTDDAMPLETETPLWQQVSMVEEANESEPLDAASFAAARSEAAPPSSGGRAPPPEPPAFAREAPPAPSPAAAREPPPAPAASPSSPAISRVQQPAPASWPRPVATPPPPYSAPPPAAPTAEARLMLQIRGLLLELSNAQQILTQRELEIERLKEELQTARAQLDAARRG